MHNLKGTYGAGVFSLFTTSAHEAVPIQDVVGTQSRLSQSIFAVRVVKNRHVNLPHDTLISSSGAEEVLTPSRHVAPF